jgi:hypothetical protein
MKSAIGAMSMPGMSHDTSAPKTQGGKQGTGGMQDMPGMKPEEMQPKAGARK